ncbi:MAG: alpha/beta hydrolase [bacterium]|nr:alpha/beta hydrolase [bacterium]MDI1335742.1 alpha/beta hydrolase [Lacunisphaera sp.]
MKARLITGFALALILLISARAQTEAPAPAAKPVVWPTDVRIEHDVAYLADAREEKADLYFPLAPPKGKLLPAVVIIHGGGFNDGDKGRPREINIGQTLALHGYVGMSINYKLARAKGVATWPQPVYDAKASVRWLRQNAARLGLDPDRIAVIGCSAGGNLAAMLALTGPADEFDAASPDPGVSAAVRCAIDFYGVVELLDYHDMKMFARTRAEAPDLYRRGSPNRYADAKDAPMLIVHGTADETVKSSHSEVLAAALTKAGVEHQLVLIPGAPHTFDLQPKERDLRPLVLEFLDKHMGSSSSGR